MLTNVVIGFAVTCLESTGYCGAAFLMMLESMIFPVPSEAVMPFVGFLVADGKWNLELAVLATSLGSITGSLLSYAMGYYGGRPLVLKVGKFLLLNRHDLARAEVFFNRSGGTVTLFVSRFVPVVRHLISIPAGMGKMPLVPFITATLVGATLWNSFLLICGMYLREHWTVVQTYSHQVDIFVVAAMVIGVFWFIRSRYTHSRRPEVNKIE
ncbi:MAG: DedA family protein [Syntrophobacteraceae bacterium]